MSDGINMDKSHMSVQQFRSLADGSPAKKPSKMRNKKTDGYDSKREAKRARELKFMLADGQINGLREQVKFVLIPTQRDGAGKLLEKECAYYADFVYQNRKGELIVEDAKGARKGTAYVVFVLKRKLMLQVHGIRVLEV